MDNKTEDQRVLISRIYREEYTKTVTHQGVGQGRTRRRRKRREPESGIGGLRKKKLNSEQLSFLEMNFENEHKLEAERKDRLALELGLDPRTVAVWFQNRRARWKSKKMEEEYFSLKKAHESIVLQKSQLESEMMKLKERLSEAEKEIQRLSSNSPSSSFSMDGVDEPPFLLDYGYGDVFYMGDSSYIIPGMEWFNPYN